MAEKKIGKVIHRQELSPMLVLFRLAPGDGNQFPDYKPGQYIALSRDNCRLTKKIIDSQGQVTYTYDLDESGNPKRGQVTHSYSISSAPFETKLQGYLEFYVVLDMIKTETPGRLSESLFHIDPESDNRVFYVNKIVGEFTLERRAAGFQNVVMVGAGTGLAPFASMVKQLQYEASQGKKPEARYTLFHANRTYQELGYHSELRAIEQEGKFDFTYVPSISRPTSRDYDDPTIGKGRVNSLLRFLFDMPSAEEQDKNAVLGKGEDSSKTKNTMKGILRPVLPQHLSGKKLLERMDPEKTVILTCGNPNVMDDVKYIADTNHIRFEKEEW
jgi:ferredoxin-NADP reductase